MFGTLTRLGVLLLALTTLFLLLPASTGLPADAYTALQTALGYLYQWDFIIPVTTLLTILKLTIYFEIGVWLIWRPTKWILHLISSSSAGST